MDFLIGTLIFIGSLAFILGSAVVIHEFGHFAVGKLLGIRVETFSVGFGPRIFGTRYGTTDYRLSLIPLGGYVKFGGDESNAAIEGESASDIPENERFDLRPRWHKFLVIIAGPFMNIMTALTIVFVSALMYGVPEMPSSPVVSRIVEGARRHALDSKRATASRTLMAKKIRRGIAYATTPRFRRSRNCRSSSSAREAKCR